MTIGANDNRSESVGVGRGGCEEDKVVSRLTNINRRFGNIRTFIALLFAVFDMLFAFSLTAAACSPGVTSSSPSQLTRQYSNVLSRRFCLAVPRCPRCTT